MNVYETLRVGVLGKKPCKISMQTSGNVKYVHISSANRERAKPIFSITNMLGIAQVG
jgi:hypothetical protein